MDAYNANPSSVELALQSLDEMDGDNKFAVLGDMFELGNESQQEHQNMVDLGNSLTNVTCFFVGDTYAKCVSEENNLFKSKELFIEWVQKNPISNSTILLKGSRGMKMETLKDCF